MKLHLLPPLHHHLPIPLTLLASNTFSENHSLYNSLSVPGILLGLKLIEYHPDVFINNSRN